VTTSDVDRALRRTFRFEAADLAANRAGVLSPRQAALLRAGRTGMILSLAVFAVVMVGTVGLVILFNRRLDPAGSWASGVGVAAAVAGIVIAIGYVMSRAHLAAARSRQLSVARGAPEVLSDAADDCRIRIGPTPLRLAGQAQVEAFRPGTEYRVYYLAGPVALVLSAETLPGQDAGSIEAPGTAGADAAERATAAAQVAVVRRGYVVVILLGVLALGIPVAGVLVGDLPPGLRPIAWIGLLTVSIGFVWLALGWLRPRRRRRAPPKASSRTPA
jgi:hypothetical protein